MSDGTDLKSCCAIEVGRSSLDVNTLYYGDNLDVLRRYIHDESVDLVYLDPPFQSGRNFNVLFEERDGTKAAAQIQAFEDTWDWDTRAAATFDETVSAGGKVADALLAFRRLLGDTPMLAYLSMMAPRLVELRRALKDSGLLFLHCDPTASSCLRLLLDVVFTHEGFVNEIIWQRATAKGLMTRRLPSNHDAIFVYKNGESYTWNNAAAFQEYDPDNLDEKTDRKYGHLDPDGRRYTLGDLTNPNRDRPNLNYQFMGHNKVWRWTKDRMEAAFEAGIVVQPSPGAVPRVKRYLDERLGKPLGDVWTDIAPVNSQAAERLGYPTQKPIALLERILRIASNEGDVVLDPFCGCGTTIDAAQRLGREWIGIDITHLAVGLIKGRLLGAFGKKAGLDYKVIGEPTDVASARQLSTEDRHQFEHWALGLVGARASAKGKGADKGIDGVLLFQEGGVGSEHKRVLLSVKSGKVSSPFVRDLRGTVEREKAAIGVLLTLEDPTRDMRKESASAGFYESPWGKHPRLQILTISDLLSGTAIDMPPIRPGGTTFKQAPRAATVVEAPALPGMEPPSKPKKRR